MESVRALIPEAAGWVLLPGYRLTRLARRIEAVVLTPGAVLVFNADRAEAQAAAIDLADFHAGCRSMPVLPIAVVQGERVVVQAPLALAGAAPVIVVNRLLLPGLFAAVERFAPVPGFDAAGWEGAAYRPVPGLMDAACRLYARHDEAQLLLASSGRSDIARTLAAAREAVRAAEASGGRHIVFITGHPGAGKTLCGLDLAFAPGAGAAFLTGNPALLHVLQAALVRDAAVRGLAARAARQRVGAVVQALHRFRDHYVGSASAPADRLLVIDEAQRCWTADYARRKSHNRPHRLLDSEPALLLDIMARHEGWCAIICLLGGGQEIHAGEGGLAEWGRALATRPEWQASAPATVLEATDPRQRLPDLPKLVLKPALHLGRPVRAYRAPRLVAWVDAVLADDADRACALAGSDLPIWLTRSLEALRGAVRGRPGERVGLVASAAGRRLRAEGLGGLLWHQDEDAVARWFLDSWPDIRSADALEVAATEFGVQGLELDRVGLCWDVDLVRAPDGQGWQARAFRANAWTLPRGPEALSNKLNAYRVLLTRARQATCIWVPRGSARDPTRDPARYDAVAAYLQQCGARPLDAAEAHAHDAPLMEPALL